MFIFSIFLPQQLLLHCRSVQLAQDHITLQRLVNHCTIFCFLPFKGLLITIQCSAFFQSTDHNWCIKHVVGVVLSVTWCMYKIPRAAQCILVGFLFHNHSLCPMLYTIDKTLFYYFPLYNILMHNSAHREKAYLLIPQNSLISTVCCLI